MMTHIGGVEAWERLLKSQAARWDSNIDRYNQPLAMVEHKPKFKLSESDSFFCMGSCFARNVEEYLIYAGRKVLSKRIISPKNEWNMRPNGFVNKFTTASMLNELEWQISPPVINESLFDFSTRGWLDLQLDPGVSPVSIERAIERRAYLIHDYFARIRQASIVVLTLGLTEVWRDEFSGRFLNASPSFYSIRREPERYILEITDTQQNFEKLELIWQSIKSLNHSAKLIVTVSPVPISETFSGHDVLVANMRSKSTLRVAAEAFAESHDDVDYYPSYDMVAMSPRALAYDADCLHVTNRAVGEIIRQFLSIYIGSSVNIANFKEIAYLKANPDVDAAVRCGDLESGFEHWLSHGQKEGRPLAPKDGPT